jgi:hypothetical protein
MVRRALSALQSCPVTAQNGLAPSGEPASSAYLGNDDLWTVSGRMAACSSDLMMSAPEGTS